MRRAEAISMSRLVYGALSEDRPYRVGLSEEKMLSILMEDLPGKRDPQCVEALPAYMAEKKEGWNRRIV